MSCPHHWQNKALLPVSFFFGGKNNNKHTNLQKRDQRRGTRSKYHLRNRVRVGMVSPEGPHQTWQFPAWSSYMQNRLDAMEAVVLLDTNIESKFFGFHVGQSSFNFVGGFYVSCILGLGDGGWRVWSFFGQDRSYTKSCSEIPHRALGFRVSMLGIQVFDAGFHVRIQECVYIYIYTRLYANRNIYIEYVNITYIYIHITFYTLEDQHGTYISPI